MKNYLLTLTALSCLAISLAGSAYAGKINRHYRPHHSYSSLNTDSVTGDSIIQFARTLIGVRYRSATSDPLRGFDCSGFVSYVFKNFNFDVPRSSPEFANIGERIRLEDAKPGDIIVFTSPTHHHRIGHVGIVLCNEGDDFEFIHSTSGKEHGVTITTMDQTYRRRFVTVIRVLKRNDDELPANG
ncbi:MAG TPA: NlpC/P60 family protein [Mucilaginibacter sp.]|jgi:cell wall-associated NlpC family hydrolase|nr:NlpC/P60 family protein [Mucilaginibacter sp.]